MKYRAKFRTAILYYAIKFPSHIFSNGFGLTFAQCASLTYLEILLIKCPHSRKLLNERLFRNYSQVRQTETVQVSLLRTRTEPLQSQLLNIGRIFG